MHKYELVLTKNIDNIVYLYVDKLDGFFSYKELLKLDECKVKKAGYIRDRVRKLKSGLGKNHTVWECITAECIKRPNNTLENRVFNTTERDEWVKNMNLIPVLQSINK